MANGGQATFVGNIVIIECDGDWDCCQREQARQKVDAMNQDIKRPPNSGSSPIRPRPNPADAAETARRTAENEAKELAQGSAGGKLKRQMKKNGDAASDKAKEMGAPDCLADKIKDRVDNHGAKNLNDVQVQMDHATDVRFGGPSNAPLVPLDSAVNNAFGKVSQHVADRMVDAGVTDVGGFVLDCPPDANCPTSYSNAEQEDIEAVKSTSATPLHWNPFHR